MQVNLLVEKSEWTEEKDHAKAFNDLTEAVCRDSVLSVLFVWRYNYYTSRPTVTLQPYP